MPSLDTLERICASFGITLSQFFADGEMVELTPELKEIFDNWRTLTPEQKNATLAMMRAFNHDKNEEEADASIFLIFAKFHRGFASDG